MIHNALAKLHCGGRWTTARKRSFIVSALRRASGRWAPKNDAKAAARIARNTYRCCSCHKTVTNTEIQIDHIVPVVDPVIGFKTWDDFIARLFVEIDGFRALCTDCHSQVTTKQREIRKERLAKEKASKNEQH
jgi:5-methylcytosine-specific restriction endonuclease McrA